jgi:2-polyprenyl-3-methyl-5-hydroxy-6-metoxy-1,4-benzoquinol methylase
MPTTIAAPRKSAPRCPVCQGESRLAARHPEADLYRCPSCDHCFSDVTSIGEQEEYGPDYYLETHRNWFNNPDLSLFRKLHRIIAEFNPAADVLDVGCGNGNLLKYIHEHSPSMRLTGIDICSLPTLPGIELIRGDAFAMDLGRQFDAVISLAVIEHVADVRTFVEKLRGLCKPGGLVMILTVNDRSLTYGLARLLHGFGVSGAFNRLYSRHHLNHFNLQSLRRLLTDQGLEVIRTIRHHSPLAAIDVPKRNPVIAAGLRLTAWGIFQIERLTGRTILQTVICRRT